MEDFLGVVVGGNIVGRGGVSYTNLHPATHSYPHLPAIEPWRLPRCSAGYANMPSRLCYPVKQTIYAENTFKNSFWYVVLDLDLAGHIEKEKNWINP